MRRFSLTFALPFLCLSLLLAGCEDSKERAERHYQTALALLEDGDKERALVELRNVLKFDGEHQNGRLVYARTLVEEGQPQEAISQYLRLAEQDPDLLEAQIELTRLTLEFDAWEEAERHGRAAQELAPGDRDVVFLNAILDYRAALLGGDTQAAAEAAEMARARSDEEPDNPLAWRLLINHGMTRGDLDQALSDVDTALAHLPQSYDFYLFKLQILNQRADLEGLENTLKTALTQFPRDPQMRASLLSLYMGQDNLEAAEAFLREQATMPESSTDEKLQVVEFLRQTKGNDSAKEELDQLITDHPEERVFQATRAALDYEIGETETAIGKMRALLDGADPSEETSSLKVMLARMLVSSGDIAAAKTQVEEALSGTPGHVGALKMRASWQIENDQPEDAILTLRTAQAGAPRDPDLMTLMGQAHERAGAFELAGERYALAVEASGQAPTETLRYVSYLLEHGKADTAEVALDDALRVSPTHVALIARMADVQIQKQNWDQVTRLIWRLRSIDTPTSAAEADRIQATLLLAQRRTEDAIAFLKDLSETDDANNVALAGLIATLVRENKLDAARTLLDKRLSADPNNPELRFIQAGLYEADNNLSAAESIYRDLLTAAPAAPGPLRRIVRILVLEDRPDEIAEIIEAAVASAPEASIPQMLLAEHQQRVGDIDGAIDTYQALYELDSRNLIVVNNLASLITTHRTDEEGLSRAYTIARRLRSSDIAAFQDTYGWIAFRRGNHAEALPYLERAAAGLPEDAIVQYHLGEAYLALGRAEDARKALTQAQSLADQESFPQMERLQELLMNLQNEKVSDL